MKVLKSHKTEFPTSRVKGALISLGFDLGIHSANMRPHQSNAGACFFHKTKSTE